MKIAHISDLHFNEGTDFDEKIYEKAVKILNKIDKDIIFISGDLTTSGLLTEYKIAQEKLKQINGRKINIPPKGVSVAIGKHSELSRRWRN